MDQLEIGKERRPRKSISDVHEGQPPRQMSPLKLNIGGQNPLEGLLYANNRQFKRSIIKINKKKLPVDFFGNDFADTIPRNNFQREAAKNRDQYNQPPLTERKLLYDRGIQPKQSPEVRSIKEQNNQTKFKGTSSFGGVSMGTKIIVRRDAPIMQEGSALRRHYRVNQTRSEQKREKPIFEQRKFTAAACSNKPDALDLFSLPKQRFEGDINDAIIFSGTFAKDFKELPSKSLGLSQPPKLKQRLERRIEYQNLKVNTIGIKNTLIKQQKVFPRKQVNSPVRPDRQLISSPKKQLSGKKQCISPVKIIVTNPDPGKFQSTPASHSGNQGNPFFDVTFYNTKSSVLPPIGQPR